LDLSKIEAGKLELSPAIYDITNLINDTVQLTVIQNDSKPVNFSLQIGENIPLTLFGDELRIKQILNNLLSNAFKYTDKGSIVMSVAVENLKKEEAQVTLVLRVEDTGQGMTPEQIHKLFDEYTRFNMEANRKTQGTGLGMSITKHLVQLMNGDISVESELGKGSIFTVRLPQRVINSGVLSKKAAENIEQFKVKNLSQTNNVQQFVREFMPYGRVLIVDDVESNLYVARGLLSPYGLSIEMAKSGFEAIERIRNNEKFDIIFMDHFMPKMDGIETTNKLRELGYNNPIIALTANALTGQAEMFLENGFDGYISKPIDIRQLNSTLNKLIRDKYPPEVVEKARAQAAKLNTAKNLPLRNIQSTLDVGEIAAIFIRDAEKAVSEMKEIISGGFRGENDFGDYILYAHSMKSALLNIGETHLSAAAKKLEQAGKERDIPLIMSETLPFLEELGNVIDKLRPLIEENNAQDTGTGDETFLKKKLQVILSACGKRDLETVNAALSELKQKNWTIYTKDLLNTITDDISNNDFDEAAKLVEEYILISANMK